MKLVIASNNAHKIKEIKAILGDHFPVILSQKEAGIVLEVEEDGTTFAQNALKKAEETLRVAPADIGAALADDSGLAVDALHGAPGVYSARYAGEGHDDAANNQKLLENMRGKDQRTCRFISAIALARRGEKPIVVQGACEGELLEAPLGQGGFGYDPLFYYPALQKSFAQLSEEEKNAVSHRKRALMALEQALQTEERQKN